MPLFRRSFWQKAAGGRRRGSTSNMSPHFHIRDEKRTCPVTDARGEIALHADRTGHRLRVLADIQVVGRTGDREEAILWLRGLGPIQVDRFAQERELENDQAGFYCCEHAVLEHPAFVVYRIEQSTWRLFGVADLSFGLGGRLEIDVELATVQRIEWQCC